MTQLLRYEAARSALAEARSIDEVKSILNKAEALRAYARIADDDQMLIDATEIRMRAERRLGILLDAAKLSGELHTGPKKSPEPIGTSEEPIRFTLDDVGVSKKLSVRAQKVGGIAERAFEGMVARMREKMALGGRRVSLDIIKEDEEEAERKARVDRVYEGGDVDDLHKLIAEGRKFNAILCDPPWHFMTRSEKGDGRSAGQHYKTEVVDAIQNLPIAQLAADDCVLFMWMVDWLPVGALDLIKAWGFEHKTTAFTWVKQNKSADEYFMGQGYWTRANPESCWLATRGAPKRVGRDVRQLIVSPIREHSRKPDIIHDQIERLVDGPYLELFARHDRDKWQTWGNELAFKMLDVPAHDLETGEIHEDGEAHVDIPLPQNTTPKLDPGTGEGALSHPVSGLSDSEREPHDSHAGSGARSPVDVTGGQDMTAAGAGARIAPAPVAPEIDIDIPAFLRRGDSENAWAER